MCDLLQHLSEFDSERAEVSDNGGAQQHVSSDVEIVVAEHAGVFRPAAFLASKTANQLLGSVQLL